MIRKMTQVLVHVKFRVYPAGITVIAAALTCVMLSSCGWLGHRDSDDSDSGVTNPILSVFPPAEYSLDDPDCLSRTDEVTLTKTGIQKWEGLSVTSSLTDLNETRSAARGPIVNSSNVDTKFRREFVRQCDPKRYDREGCVNPSSGRATGWSVTNGSGGQLRACKDNYPYDRESYEGVALTSLYHLQTARKAYIEATGRSDLPRVILETLPIVRDEVKGYQKSSSDAKYDATFYHTHNAAYAKSGNDDYVFIFPETKELGYQPRGYLWESAFVLAHEFGHLVEGKIWGNQLEAIGLERDPLLHRYHTLYAPQPSNGGQHSLAGSSNAQVFGAYSEGFADLLGFYALGGRTDSLVGIECLGFNRNPTKGTFRDGTDKVLTEDVVSIALGKRRNTGLITIQEEVQGCEVPRFEDIHAVGAILAFYINDILASVGRWTTGSVAEDSSPTKADIIVRYRLLLTTTSNLTVEASKRTLADADQFELITTALEKAVQSHLSRTAIPQGALTKEQLIAKLCMRSRELMPVVDKIPFSEGRSLCATISP